MSKEMDIASLDIDIKNLVHTDAEDITIDELRLTTSDAMGNLSPEELNGLKSRYKKITYTIMDAGMNRRGFAVTEEGMKAYVDHFHKTKNDSDLHGFYKDHDYKHIDSLMGRVVDTQYDAKNKRVRRTALIDMRHPTAKRLDMFKNLSTTMIHGKKICSACGAKYFSKTVPSCNHMPDGEKIYPRSTVAIGIEDSLVTISGYKNAKRDSLSVFYDSLSSSVPELIQEMEDDEEETPEEVLGEIVDKNKKTPSSTEEEDEEIEDADEEEEEEEDEGTAEYQEAIKEIKEGIEFLKDLIKKNKTD